MNTVYFPVCCGAEILVNFGNTSAAMDNTNYTEEQVEKFLNDRKNTYSAISVIILNSEQEKKLGKIVRKYGFRCVSRAYYKGHGNNLFLFSRVNEKVRKLK